jgi:hypothetical protein
MDINGALLVCLLLITLSCGKNASTGQRSFHFLPIKTNDDHGLYRAVMMPINSSSKEGLTGFIDINISNEDVVISSKISGAIPGVMHYQNVMKASQCPTLGADFSYDSVLIPLDGNISEQLLGPDYGPISNSLGEYVYKRSTLLSDLIADLKNIDPDPYDRYTKLGNDEYLNLDQRVIIIQVGSKFLDSYGVLEASNERDSQHLSVVACGKLNRIEKHFDGDMLTKSFYL